MEKEDSRLSAELRQINRYKKIQGAGCFLIILGGGIIFLFLFISTLFPSREYFVELRELTSSFGLDTVDAFLGFWLIVLMVGIVIYVVFGKFAARKVGVRRYKKCHHCGNRLPDQFTQGDACPYCSNVSGGRLSE